MSEEIKDIKNKEKKQKNKKKKSFGQRFLESLKQSSLNLLTFLISFIIFIGVISGLIYCSTTILKTTNIEITMNNFNNMKIVQLSDFNGTIIKDLSQKVNNLNPDIVVITGDLVDRYKTTKSDEDKLLNQFKNIKASIYFVPGDMEHYYKDYDKLKEKMLENNIIILENKTEKIKVKDKEINITGIIDPSFYYEDLETFNDKLKELKIDEPQILLSHRTELINLYVENNYEFVLTGHTHGGYIKLPFIGAIFVSNQGIFPKYVNGKYVKENTTMIVSSGIGVGQFPFRLFNRPEIINLKIK